MSDAHLAQLAAAREASRRLRRTAGVARASAMTTGLFGAITLLGILVGDGTSLVLGVALLVVASRESCLAVRLGRFEPGVPRALATNQLVLGLIVIVYALVQARVMSTSSGLSGGPSGDAQVDAIMGDIGGAVRSIMLWFYLCVALAGAASGGLMALYYSRRTAALNRFLAETPQWVLKTMRATT